MGYILFVILVVGFFVFLAVMSSAENADWHNWCTNQHGVTKYISDDDEACFVDGKVVEYR